MALRLIEMIVHEKESDEIFEILKKHKVVEHRRVHLAKDEVLVRILLDAEESETVLDSLEEQYAGKKDNRVVILSVNATLPREDSSKISFHKESPERISREELYESIKDAARCSRIYLVMVILSTIVAAVGLQHSSVAIIIGAMVIAPLLGSNMALALGTTLGDLSLLRHAVLTSITGISTGMFLAILIGALINVDPAVTEVAFHMRVNLGNIAVALASGCAGALSFTTAISSALIGVMVAVSLSPPLVTFGLLLGNGQTALAMDALSLFVMNLICINLAGVTTFLAQGIHPFTNKEKGRATTATFIAISLWIILLAILIFLIFIFKGF